MSIYFDDIIILLNNNNKISIYLFEITIAILKLTILKREERKTKCRHDKCETVMETKTMDTFVYIEDKY